MGFYPFPISVFVADTGEGVLLNPAKRPSSPMLNALRQAVDSVCNKEDFEELEKIGAGFFADVFKVRPTE